MVAFRRAAVETVEDRMVVHLNEWFPAQCKAGGEEKVRQTIRYGMERASAYGITAERDVCKYVDLMFVYSRDFDKDQSLTWPSAVLTDRAMRDPTVKMEALYEAGMKNEPGGKSHGRF